MEAFIASPNCQKETNAEEHGLENIVDKKVFYLSNQHSHDILKVSVYDNTNTDTSLVLVQCPMH